MQKLATSTSLHNFFCLQTFQIKQKVREQKLLISCCMTKRSLLMIELYGRDLARMYVNTDCWVRMMTVERLPRHRFWGSINLARYLFGLRSWLKLQTRSWVTSFPRVREVKAININFWWLRDTLNAVGLTTLIEALLGTRRDKFRVVVGLLCCFPRNVWSFGL